MEDNVASQQRELEWFHKSRKYYISFRLLNYFGLTKQALNLLVFSIECYLKTLLMIRRNLSDDEIKDKFGHKLKKLFKECTLGEQSLIYNVCHNFESYEEIRYGYAPALNDYNFYANLDKDVLALNKLILEEYNKKHNTDIDTTDFQVPRLGDERDDILRKSMDFGDTTLRFDFT